MKKFLTGRSPAPPCISKEHGFKGWKNAETLPPWLSEEDINYFAGKFGKTGFTGGLNYYRALDLYVTIFALIGFAISKSHNTLNCSSQTLKHQ